MKTKLALAALAIALATAPAKAAQCIPKSITARVLKSMNPNDLHRQFSGESRVGLSSTFIQKARIVDDLDVTYLKGDYVSPSGGFTKSVFVLLAEWDLFLLRASHARINCGPDDNVAQG